MINPMEWGVGIPRWFALHTLRKSLPLQCDMGVVSFSFDDVSQSACQSGAKVLEQNGCVGTWYVAGGLTDTHELGDACHTLEDLRRLKSRGHHIGCHTFTHKPCPGRSAEDLNADFDRNRKFLEEQGLATGPLHFSYPLGAIDRQSKRLASNHFVSCRITGEGVQVNSADLYALRSERLYQKDISVERIRTLVETTARQHAWLIFYTHDVSPDHGPYGCTPELLNAAIRMALDAGCKVLPVDKAVEYWRP